MDTSYEHPALERFVQEARKRGLKVQPEVLDGTNYIHAATVFGVDDRSVRLGSMANNQPPTITLGGSADEPTTWDNLSPLVESTLRHLEGADAAFEPFGESAEVFFLTPRLRNNVELSSITGHVRVLEPGIYEISKISEAERPVPIHTSSAAWKANITHTTMYFWKDCVSHVEPRD